MKTSSYVLSAVAVLVIGIGIYTAWQSQPAPQASVAFDPLNATYSIDDVPVRLVNGKAETGSGSARVSTAVFGQPVVGDINGDGVNDAALFLTQDMGGSGVFYSVVAAIHTVNGTQGTNSVLLGDRIAPQNIQIKDSRIIANYADRKAGEPMTTAPSVGVSASFVVEGMSLRKVAAPVTTLTYLSSTTDSTKYCNGVQMDSAGYKKTITVEHTTSTLENNPTPIQLVKETIHAATVGMCRTVLDQLAITVENGVVTIPPIDGWAGSSIVMCSCKPLVETNVLRIPGISSLVWQAQKAAITSFEECVAAGNPVMESYPRQCRTSGNSFSEFIGNELEKANIIRIDAPRPNQMISSPLTITGTARGNWYFEASFPVFLTDWDGKIIAEGIAQAKSDWMTTEFVPFEAALAFTTEKDTYSNRGTLILKKDNPSGLPKNDDALEIPVLFAGVRAPPQVCDQDAKICPDGSAVGRTGSNCEFLLCPSQPHQ